MNNRGAGREKRTSKSQPKKRTKPHPLRSQSIKVLSGWALLVVLILIAAGLTRHLLLKPVGKSEKAPLASYQVPKEAHFSKPAYEIFPKQDLFPASPIKIKDKGQAVAGRPKVAIIIDDMGYDLKIAQKFLELDGPLTFALLPKAPFNSPIAAATQAKGFEIMLHLPMEPVEYPQIDPGPGALLTAMDPDKLLARLNQNLSEIHHLRGVNNHMGSEMTASSDRMRQIFTILRKRGLYFIDSRTSVHTVCRSSAKLLKIPFAERDIFIDHRPESHFIHNQLKMLVQRAQKNGRAVGIAHPHNITFDVMHALFPKLKNEIQLVPASKVVLQL